MIAAIANCRNFLKASSESNRGRLTDHRKPHGRFHRPQLGETLRHGAGLFESGICVSDVGEPLSDGAFNGLRSNSLTWRNLRDDPIRVGAA